MQMPLFIPREHPRVDDLNASLEAVLANNGVSPAIQGDVRLIVEELASNAIEHGDLARVEAEEHELCVDIAIREHLLTLEFRESGAPFNPLEQPPPDLDADQRQGGALRTEQGVGAQRHVLERHFRRAEAVDRRVVARRHALRALRHDEHRNALGVPLAAAGPGGDDQVGGVGRADDDRLVAVQHVARAVLLGRGLQVLPSVAGLRFGIGSGWAVRSAEEKTLPGLRLTRAEQGAPLY